MPFARAWFAALVALIVFATPAIADDWVAAKLRGSVFAYLDDTWVQLHRGDVVSDQRVIRTQPSGHVLFQRGSETIDVGPNTQIQIIDRTGRRYTTVKQYYGTVEIEAEVRNVQHFAVQTPYLAAIVKGTNFVVTTGRNGSKVRVRRGLVQVVDLASDQSVYVPAGGAAQVAAGGGMSGSGLSGAGGATALPGGQSGSGIAAAQQPPPGTGNSDGGGVTLHDYVDLEAILSGEGASVGVGAGAAGLGLGLGIDASTDGLGTSVGLGLSDGIGVGAHVDLSLSSVGGTLSGAGGDAGLLSGIGGDGGLLSGGGAGGIVSAGDGSGSSGVGGLLSSGDGSAGIAGVSVSTPAPGSVGVDTSLGTTTVDLGNTVGGVAGTLGGLLGN